MKRPVALFSIIVGPGLFGLMAPATLPPRDATAGEDLLACRRAIGRHGDRLHRKAVSLLRRCETRRLERPFQACPTASDVLAIGRARDRARANMASTCQAGLPPEFGDTCPTPCAAPIDSGTTLADCIVCLAEEAATAFAAQLFPATSTVCGDGVVGNQEACDPPDDTACPGRCIAPGQPGACQCAPPESCTVLPQPPASCTTSMDCPLGYTCSGGQCEADSCVVKADCPADGQCAHQGAASEGTCICRGCGPWDCILGCTVGGVMSGCLCNSLDDCPPEDDVCFAGLCS